ncbi:MAG: potassium transporter TrkG [Phycisphaerae bacterium]
MPNASKPSLIAAIIVAALAASVRGPNSTGLLPIWATQVLQLPALLLWLGLRCSPRRFKTGIEPWLTMMVIAGAIAVAILRRDSGLFLLGTTLFIAGGLLLDELAHLYQQVDQNINQPLGLLRVMVRPWCLLILVATTLLSMPAATRSGVPDYTHNFWSHILDNTFAAVGAACLAGNTIYGFTHEYTRFGQAVLMLTTQLAGIGFCAIGLAIITPFLSRRIRLRRVLQVAFGLQIAALFVLCLARSDGISLGDGLWNAAVHAGSALWNSGLVVRDDGFEFLHANRASFTIITILAIVGSIGLPVIMNMIHGRSKTKSAGSSEHPSRIDMIPTRRLPQFEAAIALALLFFGAFFLFYFETPGALPNAWVPNLPFDLGEHRIALRDETGHSQRWRRAVYVSALLRSAGMQAIPISEGALSRPSCGLVLLWMFVGGSAGGVAGGIRTTAILLPALCVLYGRRSWAQHAGGPAVRRLILSRVPIFVFVWLCIHVIAAVALLSGSDATVHEAVFETATALNGVGFSTDLSLHLTPEGRLAMIALFVVGRWLPIVFWLYLSDRIARSLGRP